MHESEPIPIQQPLETLPSRRRDVIIAGAGPAGSICARYLAQQGFDVLLLDREAFPRHKVCGDLLIADSISLLRSVGLYDRVAALAHCTDNIDVYSPGGRSFGIPGDFLSLKRRRLDFELARAAVEVGVLFARANVVDIEPASDNEHARVTISESEQPLTARIAVIATGAVVDTAARSGLVGDPHPSAVAIRCYVNSDYRIASTIIAYDDSILPGYGWVVPLGQNDSGRFVYNVGCGTSYRFVIDGRHHLKRTLTTFLERFAPAAALMAGGTRGKIAGASLRCGLPDIARAVSDRRLIVGESAGTTYPFTGEGIGKAMESGLAAAKTIGESLTAGNPGQLAEYTAALRRLKPRYHGYETAEKWLGSRRLNEFVAGRIVRSEFLRSLIGQFMAETGDPGDLFKLSSLVKSFWK